MRIFTEGDGWQSKVNFVDENNVLVGYDLRQDCCENADWFITLDERDARLPGEQDRELIKRYVERYRFDPAYFQEVSGGDFDGGGLVRFRLVAPAPLPDFYLHLFNSHNGYYGHGFTVEHSGTKIRDGVL